MRAAVIVVVAGCARPAPPPIAQRAAVEPATPNERAQSFIDRELSVGSGQLTATRGAGELSIDGSNATFVETGQEAAGPLSIAAADRVPTWKTTSTRVRKGPVRRVGDHLRIDFDGVDDSLQLNCWHRSIVVATAGARLVPKHGYNKADCSKPGVWSPATTTRIDALICSQGEMLDTGADSGIDGPNGSIDETLWRFAAPPGIEFVQVDDDCFQTSGLRLAK